jgi:hypothetical protein
MDTHVSKPIQAAALFEAIVSRMEPAETSPGAAETLAASG